MRNALLWMAHNRRLRRWFERSAAARPLTHRFISGPQIDDGLAAASRLREAGMLAALDRLGENVTTEAEAATATAAYLNALERLAKADLGATVSGKLTQFGLDLSERVCMDNTLRIARLAAQTGSRLEIDMEGSPYTERTLDFVERLHGNGGSVRAVLQAYLYRTEGDAERMNRAGIPVRLCKGAYNEPPSIAFPKKRDVDANFVRLAQQLLQGGTHPAFATHDPAMLDAVRKGASGLNASMFEFQMLYGIRRDLQAAIVAQGYHIRIYVPYGEAWYPYFMRRLAERPANVFFILRNLFR